MVSLFGKKPEGSSIVVLDIESDSVGGALVHMKHGALPRVIVQHRQHLLIPKTLDETLPKNLISLSAQVITHISEAASRIRSVQSTASWGAVGSVVVCVASPWSKEALAPTVYRQCFAAFGDIPVSFVGIGDATAHIFKDLGEGTLFALVGGEVTELIAPRAVGTPARRLMHVGSHTLLRTLATHAGIHPHEAHSSVRLTSLHSDEPFTPAALHFAKEFAAAVKPLRGEAPLRDIIVIANEPYAEWHAKTLVEDPTIGELFEEGGVVRTLRPHHLKEWVSLSTPRGDVLLGIGAVYASSLREV